MPIYPYKCQDCDHQFEALQKMSEPLLVDCPECGNSSLRKQLTAAAFKLKGTGWYETDFKNSGKKAAEKKVASSSDGKSTSGNSDAKGDTSSASLNTVASAKQGASEKQAASKSTSVAES